MILVKLAEIFLFIIIFLGRDKGEKK